MEVAERKEKKKCIQIKFPVCHKRSGDRASRTRNGCGDCEQHGLFGPIHSLPLHGNDHFMDRDYNSRSECGRVFKSMWSDFGHANLVFGFVEYQ